MDGDPLALTALLVWCFAVAVAGGTVGLVLGNIRLPAVVAVASSPAAGAGANIGISGAAALAAAIVHVRGGRIDWRVFAWMTPPSVAGALIGGYAAGLLPDAVLLAVIGTTLLYFGFDLLRRRERRSATEDQDGPDLVALALAGLGIGLLGGLIGLILGALRMPALLRWHGGSAHRAVGTNLSVGVCVGVAGVIGHTPAGVDWEVLALGAAASVPGALLGARLTGRLSERALLRAIGAMLVVAGTAMLAQAAL
ncbi:MAG TPA: sulfite exporter TauE/SafE family protein [Thermoleophilaceae bacterium]|nr:sulfite exporter TauE/SafE family protein [Thermoleophilaceae bacterium]